MNYAQSLVEDRRGENAFKLPWVDASPPRLVTDETLCAKAARAYGNLDVKRVPISEVAVVAVGGLYVIQGSPVILAGEFGVTVIADRKLRILQRHLGG